MKTFLSKENLSRELRRQSLHIILGFMLGLGVGFNIIGDFVLLILFALSLLAAWLLDEGFHIPLFEKILSFAERPDEEAGLRAGGFVAFLFGSLLVSLFFSDKIAGASILILGLADSLAPLITQKFGNLRHPFGQKYLEGSLLGAIIAAAFASIFVPFWMALVAGFVAMLIEGIDYLYKLDFVDDNIVIPLVSAVVLSLLLL